MKLLATIALGATLIVSPARADSSKLPFGFDGAMPALKKALVKLTIKDAIKPVGCLEGSAEKRKVCTYRLGEFMVLMLQSDKGESDLTGLTMICAAKTDLDSAQCFASYIAALQTFAPTLSASDRGDILNALTTGLRLGKEARITTDDVKIIVQKALGVWFHIIATDSDDS